MYVSSIRTSYESLAGWPVGVSVGICSQSNDPQAPTKRAGIYGYVYVRVRYELYYLPRYLRLPSRLCVMRCTR